MAAANPAAQQKQTSVPRQAQREEDEAIVALSTPRLISPPITRTPPTDEPLRSAIGNEEALNVAAEELASDPVDADALSRALAIAGAHAGRHREHTPGKSPRRKRQRVYGDRYVFVGRDLGEISCETDLRRCAASYRIGLDKISMLLST